MSSLLVFQLLFRRITWRHWLGSRRSTILQILILALGISVFFAIRLANRAAVNSFENFTGMLHQASDWQISAPAGQLADATLGELRAALGDLPVDLIPVLETTAAEPPPSGTDEIGSRPMYDLVGLDLVAIQNPADAAGEDLDLFNQPGDDKPGKSQGAGESPFGQVVQNPHAVFISAGLAAKRQLKTGDHFPALIDDQRVDLEIAGIIPELPSRPAAPDNLMIMDLPALQRLTHRQGKIDRIEFTVPAGPSAGAQRAELHDVLAKLGRGRWQIQSEGDRRSAAAMMTRAFRMNLNLLSLIGLLVGLYLIFQSLDGAVVRRREEIGILRSLGLTESLIQQAWLLEATLLGLIGGLLGALLGWGGAQIAVRFVGRTVNALYYTTSVQSARLTAGELMLALGIALAASLIAGWWPARQAGRTPPAQILSRAGDGPVRKTPWQSGGFGLAILAASWLLTWLPPLRLAGALRIPLGGYGAAVGLIFGGGILCGILLQKCAQSARFLGEFSAPARVAIGHLAQSSSRHRLAAASLLCAVAMAAGMIILVASFETTMRHWISNTFQADLYVTSAGAQSASSQNRIPPETWRRIARDSRVAELNPMQVAQIQLKGVSTMLVGVDVDFSRRHPNLIWREAPANDDFFFDARDAHLGLASESFCERFQVRRGDVLKIPTPAGEQAITIAGVFCDYGNERGSLVIARSHFAAWFGDELASSLILFTRPGVDPDQAQAALTHDYPGLSILTNRHLRTEVLRVFHQTFSVTYALELIGIVVAVTGLGMTFSSMLVDRRNELTTLRALGWRRDDLAAAASLEGALLSLGSVLAGVIISVGLGWILIYLINKQSFGWTLQFEIPWFSIGAVGLLVIVSGTFTAYLVGRWGSGLAADREE